MFSFKNTKMSLIRLNYVAVFVVSFFVNAYSFLHDSESDANIWRYSERFDPNSIFSALQDAQQQPWRENLDSSPVRLCKLIIPNERDTSNSGLNGFQLSFHGNPAYYIPGVTYRITLTYNRALADFNHQRHTRFLLAASSKTRPGKGKDFDMRNLIEEDGLPLEQDELIPIGYFSPLEDDSPLQYWNSCRNIITSAAPANLMVNEMHISWTAPARNNQHTCVKFSAAMLGYVSAYNNKDHTNRLVLHHDICLQQQQQYEKVPAIVQQFKKRLRKQQRAIADPTVSNNTQNKCPCDTAKYRVFFDGLWSKLTHPYSFPAEENFVHFSNIIGASHSASYRLWQMGGAATPGMRKLAMYGITDGIQQELKARPSRDIQTIIEMDGLWFPETYSSSRNAIFRADQTRHFVSLASMVGPSPDWLVGVDSFDMCDERTGQWLQSGSVMLYPFDAGVDRGETFLSRDEPHNEPIHNITGPPFYRRDAQGQTMPSPPLARVRFQLIRIYPRTCDSNRGSAATEEQNETSSDGLSEANHRDMKSAELPVCRVSDWSPWSACTVECNNETSTARGTEVRTRQYLNPWKAKVQNCERILTEVQQTCKPSKQDMMQCQQQRATAKVIMAASTNISTPAMPKPPNSGPLNCMTSPWSAWSNCTAGCGTGTKQRTRMLKLPNASAEEVNKCQQMVKLVERTNCFGTDCTDEDDDGSSSRLVDDTLLCKVTPWSAWSACSILCGAGGIQYRSRQFRNRHLAPPEMRSESALSRLCNTTLTFELRNCTNENRTLCDRANSAEAKQDCLLERRRGPCRGYFPRFYYDSQRRACLNFVYGGCRGNANNFRTYDECQRTCENTTSSSTLLFPDSNQILNDVTSDPNALPAMRDKTTTKMMKYGGAQSNGSVKHETGSEIFKQKSCIVSDWGEWSSCSAKCGRGTQVRTRSVIRTLVKDEKCDEELKQVRSCRLVQCPVDCKMSSSFGEWSECSRSCGRGIQERVQMIEVYPRRGGRPCSLPKSEIRLCKQLPMCPVN